MYLVLFLAFVIIGVLLFLSLILFYHRQRKVKKRKPKRYIPDYEPQYYYDNDYYYEEPRGWAPVLNLPRGSGVTREAGLSRNVKTTPGGNILPDARNRQDASIVGEPHITKDESVSRDAYIPVVHVEREIPGLNKQELVHFIGSGALFNIETLAEPDEIELDKYTLIPEIEGDIVLTTRTLMIFNEKNMKKIVIDSIGKYHFQDDCVIIRRKDVKKKKDVLKLFNKRSEFKYILSVIA
ncbi:MAG TPA: hypothetical protein ENI15_08745 [Spirochaetes bacterium]|nr:hypothetical protein [Spirochaetota bacterium]